ncbi:hypothetical protein [uncultured Campylobacter sp.]|uniref:hypothetical protein n=1 Tax=uncultured Campylobacter sp. TaxID=218934 RepID=UPI003211AEF3
MTGRGRLCGGEFNFKFDELNIQIYFKILVDRSEFKFDKFSFFASCQICCSNLMTMPQVSARIV